MNDHIPHPNQTGSPRLNLVPFPLGILDSSQVGGSSPIGKWLVTSIYLPFKPFQRVTTLFRGLTDHACQLRPFFFQWTAQPSERYTPPDWPRAVRCHIVAPSHGLDWSKEVSPWWGPIIQERDPFGNQKNILNCTSAVELYPYNPWDWSIYLKISHKNQRFMWVNIPGTIDCLG